MIVENDKACHHGFLDEHLIALEKKFEIRESHVPLLKKVDGNQEKQSTRPKRSLREEYQGGGATALYVGRDGCKRKCVYCLQEHSGEDCEKKVNYTEE